MLNSPGQRLPGLRGSGAGRAWLDPAVLCAQGTCPPPLATSALSPSSRAYFVSVLSCLSCLPLPSVSGCPICLSLPLFLSLPCLLPMLPLSSSLSPFCSSAAFFSQALALALFASLPSTPALCLLSKPGQVSVNNKG